MKNSRLLLIAALAIILGLAAGYTALRYLNDRPSVVQVAGRGDLASVVLASRDLPIGTVLEESDLRVVDWPAGAVPVGFFDSKEGVMGRSLISGVQMNEVILEGKLAGPDQLGIIPLIEPGMRAMTISVDPVVGVAGFVTPQTKVDVILIMTPPNSDDPRSQTILQNLQALASDQEISETEDGEAIEVNTVTVLVSPAESEILALAESEGEIRLTLRNPLETELAETPGVRASRLFSGGSSGSSRSSVRARPTQSTAEQSAIEIYRNGVKTLIYY